MLFDPAVHHRRSIRLKGYDYSQPGVYVVTIVTQDRENFWGRITDGKMQPTAAGQMVARWWLELENKFQSARLCEFIVMPNHFHGIICLTVPSSTVGVDLRVDPGARIDAGTCNDSDSISSSQPTVEEGTHTGVPLPEIIQWYKTMTTNEYIRGVKHLGWPAFRARVWQRNYYEHIIRSEIELNQIGEYIRTNPDRWANDTENRFHESPP